MTGKMQELVVVGGGISGLALAHYARRLAGIEPLVLEADARPGGKVQTEWIDGCCCEWGPQGFLDNVPETLELADQLGLTGELVRADGASADRFIVRDGELRRVPLSPPAFLTSSILTLGGRLRVLLEPFQPRGPEEETVFAFAARRIGREAAEVLVDAMVTGVYAGDSTRLSLPSTFPRMREMEATHGSLVKAMLAKLKERRRRRAAGEAQPSGAGPAGPGGTLTTFRLGMQQLTDVLAASLASRVRVGCPVDGVGRDGDAFVVRARSGEAIRARRVAVAVPPTVAAGILENLLDPPAVEALRAIPAVRVAVVMTAYRAPRPFAHACRGFGFLVPGRERRRILGTIFCDATFPGQAPEGTTLLRTLLGGARAGELLDLADRDLVELVRRELAGLLGGNPVPSLIHVIRHDYAIPQYTLGHRERLRAIDEAAGRFDGLLVTGNGLRGVALNACVSEARRAAASLVATA